MVTTAVASGFFVFVLSVVQGENQWAATYSSTQICALKGSTVEIRCTYKYPFRVNYHDTVVEKTFWFIKQQENEPEDMRTDSEYSGRVQYHCHNNNCTLTITDLRESDSGVYKFRFTTNQEGGKYTGEPGVTLSVTGLEVQIQELSLCRFESCHSLVLTCHSSCLPSYHPSYIWYNNGHNFGKDTFSLKSYFYSKDTISCAVKGHEDFPSPSLCVSGQSCHRVNYADRRICAFKGSSVDISCSYNKHAYSRSKVWFTQRQQPRRIQPVVQTGRVRVLETERGRSTLRITELRETDSAQYHFTFKTPSFEWRSSLPGTTLTVTALEVQVTRIIRVQQFYTEAELKCHSSCSPADRLSYVWFKNGWEIWSETLYLSDNIHPSDSFSCALKGHEDFPSPSVYPPKLPSVSVSPSGQIVEGSSVTLTCSSDANPAAKYTWYKEDEDSPKASGQIFTITDLRPEHSGNYSCEAQNTRGRQRSTLNLTVRAAWWKLAATGSIAAVLLVLILLAAVLLIRRNKSFTQQRQLNEGPVYENPSATAQTQAAGQQDDLHYTSISFSQNQTDAVDSNIRVRPHRGTEEDRVEYSAVRFKNASSAPGTRHQEDGQDSLALYSTVNKNTN